MDSAQVGEIIHLLRNSLHPKYNIKMVSCLSVRKECLLPEETEDAEKRKSAHFY